MISSMAFTISEIANQIGLRPSAIRYYEQIGILHRRSERVDSDDTMLPLCIGW